MAEPLGDREPAIRFVTFDQHRGDQITAAAFMEGKPRLSFFIKHRGSLQDASQLHIGEMELRGSWSLPVKQIRELKPDIVPPIQLDLELTPEVRPPLEEFADAHAELCNAPRHNKRKFREVAQALARVYSDHGLMEREPREEP